MKCEICNELEATTYVSYIIAGQECKLYVCAVCAEANKIVMNSLQSLGIDDLAQELGKAIDNILLPNINNALSPEINKSKKCNKCGTTLDDIKKTGKLGCPYDYEVFGEELKPGLLRIHRSIKHVGKCPSRTSPIEQLKLLQERLDKAVEMENYEEAATLRDKIKGLQNKENKF